MNQKTPLSRKTPMSRGKPISRAAKPMGQAGFKRIAPDAEAKPKAKVPRAKKCAHRSCRAPYMPDQKQPFKTWCSDDCAVAIGLERLARQKAAKAKAERAADRRKKQDGMTLKDHLKATEKVINRYVVLRDRHDRCISCEKGAHWDGVWHASHFKSVGSNSALRFNLWNIHKSCAQCNFFECGAIAKYEVKLAQKIGQERVDWLKHHERSREYTAEYLIRLRSIFARKIRRLERRKATTQFF